MSLNSELGKIMRDIRKQRKLTMRDVHAAGGPSLAFQSDVERGERSISINTLWAWCLAVDTSPMVLIQRLNSQMRFMNGGMSNDNQ